MAAKGVLETRFTRLVGCKTPIQQAGMGGVATPELALAVTQAGALGMVTATLVPPAALVQILGAMQSATRGPFGVSFLLPFLDQRECVGIAARAARVVEFFWGAPDPTLVADVHAGGALAAWQVGSADEARAAAGAGCDFVVAQGQEAGGHVRGRLGLLSLLDAVLGSLSVPVVAAGGIATPRAMAAVLAAGAAAVRVGTRFVTARESGAHPTYVKALVEAGAEDTVLTDTFSVMWPNAPHRVLRSCVEAARAFPKDVTGEIEISGGRRIAVPRFGVPCPTRETTGEIEAMALYAGESVGQVCAVQPAAAIVAELSAGAEQLLRAASPAL
ncbi:MAG TPA: nitronate monooxygenase [Myxococcota bacterium]|nr:nitronate monooxygenase [Myxococcota bacterium]